MATARVSALAPILLTIFTNIASCEVTKIVAPSGVEDRDGNTFIPGATFPFRSQELYVASDFDALPAGGAWLIATSERADAGQRRSVDVGYEDVQITFGTTSANNLDREFAKNLGSSMTVIDGPVELSYEVDSESPNPFSATWEFNAPYFYDPAKGNLVVDLNTTTGPNRTVRLDSQQVSENRGSGGGPNSSRAGSLYRNSFIQQFTFVPIGDINFDGTVDASDVDALKPGPFDLNGDLTVDENDRWFWIREIMSTWVGDSNLDGEFNSGDLIEVFQAGKFELDSEASWSDGDWNGDGRFNTSDLTSAFQDGGFERGPRTALVQAVPEPTGLTLLFLAMIATIRLRHDKARNRNCTSIAA